MAAFPNPPQARTEWLRLAHAQALLLSASLDTADYIPSATADDPSATPAELKEKGNALFRAGEYRDAVGMYKAALTRAISEAPLDTTLALLCNSAHCSLSLDDHLTAARYASSALAIEPRPDTSKAHYRHALALLNLGHAAEAQASCERGRALFPGEAALVALGPRIASVLTSATARASQQVRGRSHVGVGFVGA